MSTFIYKQSKWNAKGLRTHTPLPKIIVLQVCGCTAETGIKVFTQMKNTKKNSHWKNVLIFLFEKELASVLNSRFSIKGNHKDPYLQKYQNCKKPTLQVWVSQLLSSSSLCSVTPQICCSVKWWHKEDKPPDRSQVLFITKQNHRELWWVCSEWGFIRSATEKQEGKYWNSRR